MDLERSPKNLSEIGGLIKTPITRRTLLGSTFLAALTQGAIGRAFGVTNPVFTQILGRPTTNSVSLSLISSEALTIYIEYGYSKSKYSQKSKVYSAVAAQPLVIDITNLKSNARVYYRVRFKSKDGKSFASGKQYSFMTARTPGSKFSFTVQGDTHPERVGKMFRSDLYYVTMANIAAQLPDFHILMGDDFSIDPLIGKGQATQQNVEKIYKTHRDWLTIPGSTTSIFLVNGNHEQAAAYLLDGTSTNPAVLAGNARNKFYPLPAPNSFYSGNQEEIPAVGLPRDYYSWTWGDALFVTLDPYWHSSAAVDNVAGDEKGGEAPATGGGGKGGGKSGGKGARDLWKVGIGDTQYQWLKKVLEESNAKYKFVFAHHVLGTGRGGVEVSTTYEWGGVDPKGETTFAKERPNWELPIHDLMVKNKVSIFFQGHDHIFVTQERDGLIYQSMPNPADDTFSYFNDAAYKSGTKAPNTGHVRVTIEPEAATVEYFLAARATDSGRKNLDLAHTYKVGPKL
jgi:hypothetical protein